ncbi:MAG: FecR domain-containing protein [Planctomycetota bacterium]
MLDRPEHFDQIDAYLDGTLTEAETAALRRWIEADAVHAVVFAERAVLHHQIHGILKRKKLESLHDPQLVLKELLAMEQASQPVPSMDLLDQARRADHPAGAVGRSGGQQADLVGLIGYGLKLALTSRPAMIAGVAAVLVLVLTLVIVFSSGDDRPGPIAEPHNRPNEPGQADLANTPRASDPAAMVATLTADYGVRWQTVSGAVAPQVGSVLTPGRQLSLADGAVRLTTRSGAVVTLQGPAEARVHTQGRVELLHGRLLARCETPESKGFTVFTDTIEVTDIGTVFAVERDAQGRTITGVLDGHVALSYKAGDNGPRLLRAGDVAGVSADGVAIAQTPASTARHFEAWGSLLRPVTVTGDAIFEDSMPDQLPEDQERVRVYREAVGVLLNDDLVVSQTETGLYRPIDPDQKSTLAAGTRVDSYLVYIDRPRTPTDILTKRFTITFEQPVAALVVHRQLLLATDRNFGSPGMQNAKAGGRGLVTQRGFGPDNPQIDSIRWSDDRKTLDVTLNVQNHDQFRVLTLSPEAALAEGNRE